MALVTIALIRDTSPYSVLMKFLLGAMSMIDRLFSCLILLASSLLSACVGPSYNSYPPTNTTIGETKEWRMPLYREPGHIALKLQFVRGSTTSIALQTANEIEQAPVHVFFLGSDCSQNPDVYVRYSFGNNDYRYKHFKSPLAWEAEVNVNLDWDEKGKTFISLNGEKISVQPNNSFRTLHIRSGGGVNIKELAYTKLDESPSLK